MPQTRVAIGTLIRASAILFDMDGTLIDSTSVVERLWTRWAIRRNVDPEKVLRISHGRPTIETMRQVAPHLDYRAEASDFLADELAEAQGILAIPGALELVTAIPRDRWALVTSADRTLAVQRLRTAMIPEPKVLVAADDGVLPKPSPDGYLRAAALLGFPAGECLVIEDTRPGLEAGRAAGMRVLAVTTTYSAEALDDPPWVRDLASLRLQSAQLGLILRVVC
jgi:sugar-phosphatase